MRLLTPLSGAEMARTLSLPLEHGVGHRDGERRSAPVSGPAAATGALLRLAEEYDASPTSSLAHPYSPLGIVQIDGDRCTGCGACAEACPTGALALRSGENTVSITFDPTLCNGCFECGGRCPEQAIRIDRVTDLQRLSGGRVSLHEDREVRCQGCDTVIGPAAMLRRIEELLYPNGDSNTKTIAAISLRCPSCRIGSPLPTAPGSDNTPAYPERLTH